MSLLASTYLVLQLVNCSNLEPLTFTSDIFDMSFSPRIASKQLYFDSREGFLLSMTVKANSKAFLNIQSYLPEIKTLRIQHWCMNPDNSLTTLTFETVLVRKNEDLAVSLNTANICKFQKIHFVQCNVNMSNAIVEYRPTMQMQIVE